MTKTNQDQDSPNRNYEASPIDMEALRRFGRWWEARVALLTGKEHRSDAKDDRDAA